MSRYKYLIKEKEDKFLFGLYPNNSNMFPMIVSEKYDTKKEAIEAINRFKAFVEKTVDDGKIDEIVRVYERNSKYTFAFENLIDNIKYEHSRLYDKEENCYKGIKRVFENINADIK